jgi:RNA polymerase sigma-70 factor (ECF subfamily)
MTRDRRPESPHGQPLADLFREHGDGLAGAVRGVLGAADVQEILQEAFLKALRALQDGLAPRHPVAWIFVITMNLARDQRRKDRRRDRAIEDQNPMELQSKEPAPAARLERDEALAAARDAIHELEPKEREVFLLRTSAELSFQDTAEALRIPIGTAKTRMRAALARLRRSLWAHMPRTQQPAPAVQPIHRLHNIDNEGTARRKTS